MRKRTEVTWSRKNHPEVNEVNEETPGGDKVTYWTVTGGAEL
jgi:hypothetical protein